MNTRRLIFWTGFIVVLALIIWGLIVAMGRTPASRDQNLGTPAPVGQNDHVKGPDNALVTIIEYSDFQCPACQAYYFVMERVLASSTVPVRLVYRHFPLAQHANAMPASLASEAAGVQGKFWEMYGLLFENYSDWVDLRDPKPEFAKYASEIGLDLERFNTDMASSTLREKINADYEEGFKIGVNATPTFFVNGKVITNPSSYDEFKTIIEKAAGESIQ